MRAAIVMNVTHKHNHIFNIYYFNRLTMSQFNFSVDSKSQILLNYGKAIRIMGKHDGEKRIKSSHLGNISD